MESDDGLQDAGTLAHGRESGEIGASRAQAERGENCLFSGRE
jgi:hypothetical protein